MLWEYEFNPRIEIIKTAPAGASSPHVEGPGRMIDIALLHSKVAGSALDFLRELFAEDVKRAGHDQWRVGRRGSLAITIRDNVLVFFSHEESQGGDAVALWQRQRGGSMGEALKAVAAWAHVADENGRGAASTALASRKKRVPQEPASATPPRMPWAQVVEAHAMIRRLAYDEALCGRIAQARGWKTETIRGLTGDGALGWSDGWPGMHQGALAFCYESGIKQRWRRGGERVIRWYCGGPATLWRDWMVLDVTKELFITEGETDAISMIDAGAEASLEVLVVALPNAGIVPHGIGELVRGRRVVLSLDNDKAGRAASEKIAAVIQPFATKLDIWKAQ